MPFKFKQNALVVYLSVLLGLLLAVDLVMTFGLRSKLVVFINCLSIMVLLGITWHLRVWGRMQAEKRQKDLERAVFDLFDFRNVVFNVFDFMIFVIDKEGRCVLFNRSCEQRTGYKEGEVSGKRLLDFLVHPKERDAVGAVHEALFNGQEVPKTESTWIGKDGSKIRVLWSDHVIRDSSGEIEYVSGIGMDITENHGIREQITKMQKAESLGVLAGGIAHDFNNILNSIILNLDLVAREEMSEKNGDRLNKTRKAAVRASELVRQILIYAGKLAPKREVVNLNDLVNEMYYFINVSISKKVNVELLLKNDLPLIVADSSQIRQIVLNLITNAADAIGENEGSIRVETSLERVEKGWMDDRQLFVKPGQYLKLEIEDNGVGIAHENLPKIFDPFFTTKSKGWGLGLSAILGILKAHNAGIKIKSELGVGTWFCIYFPVQEGASESHSSLKEMLFHVSAKHGILVVDDEPMIREATCVILEKMGYAASAVESGAEAIEKIRSDKSIRIVLMDLRMPKMDGVEAAQAIKAIDESVQIVLVSGFLDMAKIQDVTVFSEFLAKPYDQKDLEQIFARINMKSQSDSPVRD